MVVDGLATEGVNGRGVGDDFPGYLSSILASHLLDLALVV